MKTFTPLPLFFLALFLSCSCFGQNSRLREIDKALQKLARQNESTGSVLVAKQGKILYQKNAGFADIEHEVHITASTRFELASVSKTFTALLVLQLVEKGKISLDANISRYMPEFTRKDSGEITIHHLLSHTSGIQDFVGLNCPFADWTEKEFLEGLSKTHFNFPPGARFEYSSSTYVLLRFIIERVTGISYERNLQEHILKVAAMQNTGVLHNNAILRGRAVGYVNTDKGYQNASAILNHEIFLGAASVYSTTHDLLKFDRCLYGNKLLSAAYKEKLFTIVQPPYGYGWFISEDPAKGKIVSHGGDLFGFTTLIERRLKDQVLIVILSNQQSVDRQKIVSLLDKALR